MGDVKPIPDGFGRVTPHMVIRDCSKAMEFYTKAFGAEEVLRMPAPGGGVMYAEMKIGGSTVMMADEQPQMEGWVSPQQLNGSSVALHLYVNDVDAAFQRASEAGVTVKMPPMDMFWGDRYCMVIDPFGHHWSIATHKEDLTPEEIGQRAEAFFAQMGKDGEC